MLRAVLVIFTLVVGVLVTLALQPDQAVSIPDPDIHLRGAAVRLHPRADADAVWLFAAPEATYTPDSGVSVLKELSDGRRTLEGQTDFTVAAAELLIDSRDNLRGDRLLIGLTATGECLTMLGTGDDQVVIDQADGRFLVPLLHINGPSWGSDNSWQKVNASFDLEDFSAGGPGTVTVNEFFAGPDRPGKGKPECAN